MIDDKRNPLLDQSLDKEYEFLNEESTTFNTSIEDIYHDLECRSVEDNINISNLVMKLQNVKAHMQRINDKIHYLKNYMIDDIKTQPNNILIFSRVKKISDNISRRYEEVNKKFADKIEMAKKKIQIEIDQRTTADSNPNNNKINKMMLKYDPKVRLDLDRLRERQQDLEKITKISYQLLELSRDMRREADKQERIVSSIEDHITISNIKTNEANEQLCKKKETQTSNVRLFFWICTTLLFLIIVAGFIFYLKYWRQE